MDADVHPGPAPPVVVVVRFVSLAWVTAGGPTIMLLFSGKRTRLLRPRSRLLSFGSLGLSLAACLVRGSAACSWSRPTLRGLFVVRGGLCCCCRCSRLLRSQSENAPPARRWVDRRQSDEGKRTGIVLHGRRSASAAADADLDPRYCPVPLPFCRCCFSRRRRGGR